MFWACLAQPALARNDVLHLSFQDVLNSPEAKGKLDSRVRFFLAGQNTPKVVKTLGSDVSNPKTNGFNKTAAQACNWAALSALIALQKRTLQNGGNAVIEIVSFYKGKEFSSATQYECHDGAFAVAVSLKGTYATIED
ncbi:MAG: excinuclease ATPase subunit [Rhodoferax sp.]|nr:excinuclease ATPase subunit [Rhodoferax sp.]